jgi:hypothetical protein
MEVRRCVCVVLMVLFMTVQASPGEHCGLVLQCVHWARHAPRLVIYGMVTLLPCVAVRALGFSHLSFSQRAPIVCVLCRAGLA